MREWMILEDASAFKALAHPLRVRILSLLTERKASVKELSLVLDMVHAKVHYHVMELVKNRLVEQVDQAVKNGIIEKYYRAVAKTFFVGQSLGHHTDIARTALSAVEEDMLRRRRDELLEIDYEGLAHRIICESLRVAPGSKVLVEGSPAHSDLMEALAVECRKVGAEAMMRIVTAEYFSKVMMSVDTDILRNAPPFSTLLYQHVDYWVSVGTLEGSSALRDVTPQRMSAWKDGGIRAIKMAHSGLKSLIVEWPSKAWADERGLSYVELHDAFWRALKVPVGELEEIGENIVSKLRSKELVVFRGDCESWLELELSDTRPIYLNDGRLHEGVKEDFDADLFLPGGKVIFAPIEKSVRGYVVVPNLDYRGSTISNIRLTIDSGLITSIEAGEHTELVHTILTNKGGLEVGSVSIGFNPGLVDYEGGLLFELIKPHSLGLGLGANAHLGGEIESVLPLYLAVSNMTLVDN